MLNRRNFVAISAAIALSPAPLFAARLAKQTRSYGPESLDIYVEAERDNLPVMVYVHGGAWRIGSRSRVLSKPGFFADLGFLFVSIDYRMLPDAGVATQSRDVGKALHWVKNNIANFGGDPDRIALMGHSAGAHLAALATLKGETPPVSALICNDTGAYDLAGLAALRGGNLPRVVASAFPDPAQWAALSPVSYVGRQQHPPTLLMWSRIRNNLALANRFGEKLNAVGTQVSTFGAPDLSHEEINKLIGTGRAPQLNGAISNFLGRVI